MFISFSWNIKIVSIVNLSLCQTHCKQVPDVSRPSGSSLHPVPTIGSIWVVLWPLFLGPLPLRSHKGQVTSLEPGVPSHLDYTQKLAESILALKLSVTTTVSSMYITYILVHIYLPYWLWLTLMHGQLEITLSQLLWDKYTNPIDRHSPVRTQKLKAPPSVSRCVVQYPDQGHCAGLNKQDRTGEHWSVRAEYCCHERLLQYDQKRLPCSL